MAHPLVRILERNPVIPALKSIQQVEQCASTGCEAAFLLCGDILNIADVIDMLHKAGKKAVVHADLVNGLAPREIAADYLHRCGADGIISPRPLLVRRGHELGMLAVLRVFAIDSKAVNNLKSEVEVGSPDMIEVLPGVMPRVLSQVRKDVKKPLIAGGLIADKADILSALNAGAVCVSTSDSSLWEI